MSYKLKREEKRSPKNEEAMLLKLEPEEQHQFATTPTIRSVNFTSITLCDQKA
ncbi:hypothetical protein [Pectobacterium brasiliense]|uniref:hypothetical protein n=1 Tax=Pectobacterium brasiliense TaxID=180957 RepID=UPI0019690341|nr:hypothetical protein [Pectobacterium brasiliense]MBN3121961.1 hypothetical protein [Pectobacterium brasiliense]QSD22081.1 hypothetical protein H5A38_17550 [Pectobacterium brasiliense]